jgi:hypothetical protein
MSATINYAQVFHWLAVNEERFQARVAPTNDDQKWFQRNKRSRDGWPRLYRVRPALMSDHWVFDLGLVKPTGFLTIIRGGEWWRAIVASGESEFGPVVDSDDYARMRLQHMPGADLRNDPQSVSQ